VTTHETRRLKSLSVGQRIRWAREKKGVSQERFAEQIGTTRRHMIRIEKGQHMPGPALIARIVEATDEPDAFFAANGSATADDDEESDPVAVELVRALMARLDETIHREVDQAIARLHAKQEPVPAATPLGAAGDGPDQEAA
jgi:transcriptional regulator with XRE-family HTH domain